MPRRTKIVATLGPASDSAEQIAALIAAGMDVARLNLSHGTVEGHLEVLVRVRAAAEAAGRQVGILVDLPGPKVRSGVFPEGGVHLSTGQRLALVPGDADDRCDVSTITVDYPSLLDDLQVGDIVILGDGAVTLRVDALSGVAAQVEVMTGGRAVGRPGVHIPSERLRLQSPTDADLVLLEGLAAAQPDFVAVSFVRAAADLRKVREALGDPAVMLVAKIETLPAITNLDEIIAEADAVMVARGDLGIECPLEDVPHLQKSIIRTCVEAGVPVITATQMLESMIMAETPTRAEVSDVANAVFDGTDAVMLSAETAIGRDPVEVVRTMARIAERAESSADYPQWAQRLGRSQRKVPATTSELIERSITHAAWQACTDCSAAAVIACTLSGRTARSMARFRPTSLLLGMSPNRRTARQLTLSWGIVPMLVGTYSTTDEMVWCVIEAATGSGLLATGDLVAVLAGAPDSVDHTTDVLRIVRLV